ncbi:MAG: hypothetical protein ACR2GD_03435 [Pyrinomonadaceae bacterium]
MNKHHVKRTKQCLRCLRGNPLGSKDCAYCDLKFTSTRKYSLTAKLWQTLQVEKIYKVLKKTPEHIESFFLPQEIENLLRMNKITILMFLTLDNVDLLDEKALMDLGRILGAMKH